MIKKDSIDIFPIKDCPICNGEGIIQDEYNGEVYSIKICSCIEEQFEDDTLYENINIINDDKTITLTLDEDFQDRQEKRKQWMH